MSAAIRKSENAMNAGRDEWGEARGIAALEMALLLPVILLICTLAAEFGHVYWIQGSLQSVAREGALGMSRAQAATFGAQMDAVAQQMHQDLGQAGFADLASIHIQLSCLDSSFALLGAGSWCVPGGTAPADSALAYVQSQVTWSVPAPGSWMPFYTVLGNSSQILLTGVEMIPYGP